MAFSAILELPRRFVSFINRILHGWDTLSEDVGDESAEESDWSSEEEGSASKRPRNNGGHRKARRGKSRKDRKPKEAKGDEKGKSKPSEEKQEATPVPSVPVTRLAEVLSSKEGLKSAALKSAARENSSTSDEVDGKVSEDGKELKKDVSIEKDVSSDSTSPTVIKIKPPPTAPKPRVKRTNSTQSSNGAEVKSSESRRRGEGERHTTTVMTSHGSIDDGIFDGMEITKPKLTSYKRTMGPQGRRLPQRYSNQVQSQRYSSQSTNSLATVSA